MSLNEQLIEDMASQFLTSDGIAKLIDKMPIDEHEISKIKEFIANKELDVKLRRILRDIGKYIRFEEKPIPASDLIKDKFYIEIYFDSVTMVDTIYIVHLSKIEINENVRLNGTTIKYGLLYKCNGFRNVNISFKSWIVPKQCFWYRLIDEAFLEKAGKLI